MGLFHLAKNFAMTIRESANDGSDFANPDADFRVLFLGEDGNLYVKDSAGTVAAVGIGTAPQFTTIELGHASDTTLARASAGNITVEGNALYRAGGTDVALADGGTGASLTDPNADRIMFWDDSAGAVAWLEAGSGLSISGTTMTASGGGGSITVSENFLTSATTISSTNTFFDGPSLSLAAGTYLLDAAVTIDVQTSAHFTAKIWDGTTLMSPTVEHFHATSGGQLCFAIPGYAVLGSTTTVKVSVAANNGTNNAIDNTGATNSTANKSSYLRATKIA